MTAVGEGGSSSDFMTFYLCSLLLLSPPMSFVSFWISFPILFAYVCISKKNNCFVVFFFLMLLILTPLFLLSIFSGSSTPLACFLCHASFFCLSVHSCSPFLTFLFIPQFVPSFVSALSSLPNVLFIECNVDEADDEKLSNLHCKFIYNPPKCATRNGFCTMRQKPLSFLLSSLRAEGWGGGGGK